MRKWGQYAIIVFQILLIISLARGIQLSKRSNLRITSLEESRDKLLVEQEKLRQQEAFVQSPYYLEKVAREELHLSKEGETVVIVPEGMMQESGKQNQESVITEEKANWRKWLDVITGKD